MVNGQGMEGGNDLLRYLLIAHGKCVTKVIKYTEMAMY